MSFGGAWHLLERAWCPRCIRSCTPQNQGKYLQKSVKIKLLMWLLYIGYISCFTLLSVLYYCILVGVYLAISVVLLAILLVLLILPGYCCFLVIMARKQIVWREERFEAQQKSNLTQDN